MTLAYVFWHRPRADVDPGAYAAALDAFHATLAGEPPPGLRASWASRLERAPWADERDGWFEDWYLVDDPGALAPLERAAIDARHRATHDAAAAGTEEGMAGLYGLRSGVPGPPAWAAWAAKPDGTAYAEFEPALTAAAQEGSVWQRRLVLGPTPEYAVLAAGGRTLPAQARTTGPRTVVARRPAAAPRGPALRDARPAEAERLTAIALRSKAHWGYDESFMVRARAELTVTPDDVERYAVRVAVDDAGEPLGFRALDPGPPHELVALFVDVPAIGTGAGRALLADARREVAAGGATGMLVESDPNAVGFYRHHGAIRIGDRRSLSTGRWLPLLWLPAEGA